MPTSKISEGRSYMNDEVRAAMKEYLEDCPNEVPSVSGLLKVLGRSQNWFYDWVKKDEYTAWIFEQIKIAQEVKLIDKGLTGDFNPAITKMLLVRHGYADKVETDVTSNGKQLNMWTVNPVSNEKE